ncbi:MAG: shikimate dehydrogenase [Chloroflexi bacterium]|nr:MAG: shikimate dehydrogenase [Chloroflexota bacterium]MBL1197006.1 shikimate dehydrogenase [Chloroflexota bacterium]NOH14301.1 shikimate dehydrogenase [Chloroflexota bacterium]
MDSFAFIIHPIDPKRDVSRKFPLLGKMLSERQIDFFSTFFPPIFLSEVQGIISAATGKQITGWLIAAPYTPRRMLQLPEATVYRKIIQTGRMAERLGANMLGLGAFTSVIGDAGISIANGLDVPVTTGDAYTIAVAVEALEAAARVMERPIADTNAAVVGATGTIGRVCAELLAGKVAELHLIGRRQAALEELREHIQAQNPQARVKISTNLDGLGDTPLILTVTSSLGAIIEPEHLQPGSVVCDVARPRDVSTKVAMQRDDVLVIEGGMVEVPGPVEFNFDFGFPRSKAYACMAETIALTLEGRFEDYTLGKEIKKERVEEIATIAHKHGFRLSGFRSFEKAVSAEHIEKVRQRARHGQRPVLV